MDHDFMIAINSHCLEYIAESHSYIVDGIILPSITQLVRRKLGNKFADVDPVVLRQAADAGTRVHDAIENFVKRQVQEDLPEVRNFKFLMKRNKFTPIMSELPVILSLHGDPIAAGRLDLVLVDAEDKRGLADIKRTSVLDKEYLFYQLNFYRLAYEQCYGTKIEFLRGLHLREDVRKCVKIPIDPDYFADFLEEVWNDLYGNPETAESNPREVP